MPRVRDIIVHVSVEVAKRKRKCSRKPAKHSIEKGDSCLVIKGGSYNAPQSYCRECAAEILELADKNLDDIKLSLNLSKAE